MEYKIDRYGLGEDYFFNDTGEVYYYMPQSVNKSFVSFTQQAREVTSNRPGRSTHYVVGGLRYVDGLTDWVDIADMMARIAFKIPTNTKGYTRHKNHKHRDLALKNLEFVSLHPVYDRPEQITDYNGSIPYNMYKEEASSVDKESMTILPGEHGKYTPGKRTPSDSVKMDLGDRDRSVVAELLYTLITEKEMSAADALKTLAIPGGYDTLELFLEGKDVIEERVVNDIERAFREDQERDKKEPPRPNLSWPEPVVPSFKSNKLNVNKIGLNIDNKL